MFTSGTVTVITPTIGHRKLPRCVESVQQQTFPGIEHLLVVDGPQHESAVRSAIGPLNDRVSLMNLPHATGREKWNGHRIYGAAAFLINTEFIAYLDEDNWYDPTHIELLISALQSARASWAFSLRKIVDESGNVLTRDDCESLGTLHSVWNNPNDRLIDTSCYLLRREVAVAAAPVWYGPARPPRGVMERDRALCQLLMQHFPHSASSLQYTLNYTVGNRSDSVQAAYFFRGNEMMRKAHPDGLPWEQSQNALAEIHHQAK
ncbi:MAG TPA: glycosyltransferase family A protein [Tepidisphaeraceae bacterium]|nr:glycosyltransferase family A protein [Tepidisphaeraceae bacterium]